VAWTAQAATSAPDLPPAPARIVSVIPNPFNPRATVTFRALDRVPLRIAVYDLAGRFVQEIAAGVYDEGIYTATWDGEDAAQNAQPSGVYLVRLVSGEHKQSYKAMLVR
jgi:hypothetical protein